MFLIAVALLNTCLDDFLHRVKRMLNRNSSDSCNAVTYRNVLPSDRIHYLQLGLFVNRFVWFFTTTKEVRCPLLDKLDDDDRKAGSRSVYQCRDQR